MDKKPFTPEQISGLIERAGSNDKEAFKQYLAIVCCKNNHVTPDSPDEAGFLHPDGAGQLIALTTRDADGRTALTEAAHHPDILNWALCRAHREDRAALLLRHKDGAGRSVLDHAKRNRNEDSLAIAHSHIGFSLACLEEKEKENPELQRLTDSFSALRQEVIEGSIDTEHYYKLGLEDGKKRIQEKKQKDSLTIGPAPTQWREQATTQPNAFAERVSGSRSPDFPPSLG